MPEVTDELIDEVVAKADAVMAFPGCEPPEGAHEYGGWYIDDDLDDALKSLDIGDQSRDERQADAEFIARMDPLTSKALALEVRRLREENAALTRDLDLARHGAYRGGPKDGEE